MEAIRGRLAREHGSHIRAQEPVGGKVSTRFVGPCSEGAWHDVVTTVCIQADSCDGICAIQRGRLGASGGTVGR